MKMSVIITLLRSINSK